MVKTRVKVWTRWKWQNRGLIPNTLVLPHWLALTFSVLIIGGGGRGPSGEWEPRAPQHFKIGENDGSSCLDVGTLFSDKPMWWKYMGKHDDNSITHSISTGPLSMTLRSQVHEILRCELTFPANFCKSDMIYQASIAISNQAKGPSHVERRPFRRCCCCTKSVAKKLLLPVASFIPTCQKLYPLVN